jgi:probable rRNA maturation factor
MIYIQVDSTYQVSEDPGLESDSALIDTALLEKTARQALEYAGQTFADLTLVLTGDHRLRELNCQFLGVDAPTDVLSFPAGDVDPDSQSLYLGDVIISYPRAVAQAEGQRQISAELQLLVVHGVLHLLGYDHAEAGEKPVMWGAQEEILKRLGLVMTV